MRLTCGSLFAGIGGFDLAFARAGCRVAWAVELDPQCRRVLAARFPASDLHADVRDCGAHNLAPVDVITFGSPCQDLSVAGRRAGFDGARSGLFFEAVRIIRELRPRYAVWENVPGALSSQRGRDFGAALDALADAGAVDLAWRVLDAQWFGVAQRRRRLFLVADFGGERAGEILFERDGGRRDTPPRREAGQGVAYCLAAGAGGSKFGSGRQGQDTFGDEGVPEVIAFGSKDSGADAASDLSPTLRAANFHESWANGGGPPAVVYVPEVAQTLTGGAPGGASHGKKSGTDRMPMVAHSIAVRGRDDGQEWELGEPEIGNALRAGDGGSSRGNWALTPALAVRRLTPTECLRLQGYPDDWLDLDPPLADSAKYRQVGNSVAVPVVAWLAGRLAGVCR